MRDYAQAGSLGYSEPVAAAFAPTMRRVLGRCVSLTLAQPLRVADDGWVGYVWGLAVTAVGTAAILPLAGRIDLINIAMLYMLGATAAALWLGPAPSALTAVANVLAFDFFFVPPRYSLAVYDASYMVTFSAMLLLSLVSTRLVIVARQQTERAQRSRIEAERTAICNTLLASISHDLRTPLSAIASAGSVVAQSRFSLAGDRRITLGKLIEEKARDMSEVLSNVLDLVKLESCATLAKREWHRLADIVDLAIQRNDGRLAGRDIRTEVAVDLPLVSLDATLFVQLLSNLLDNAVKYTPPETRIHIAAMRCDAVLTTGAAMTLRLVVEDNGPGWGSKDPERLFEKFARGQAECATAGIGLGLTICRAIARLHDSEIRATCRRGGGARVEIDLPVPKAPADVMVEFEA